jgi:helix-turn-helix, Psq domain./Tc5 transposase DNA-binding domain.
MDREQAIQLALAELNEGKFTSARAAARAHNVPKSSLQDRKHGRVSNRVSHERKQRMTPAQEEFLAEWILEQAQQGFPPTRARAREMAARVLRMNGDTAPMGKTWLTNFIRRHPQVATVINRRGNKDTQQPQNVDT